MRSSTNKVKTSNNNNKEPEYDTDFTEYNESNTKLKPTTTKTYSSRTPSSDGGGGGKNQKTTNKNTNNNNNNNNNKSRAYSSDSRSNSSRSISRSVSKSRSLSPANKNANKPNTKQKNSNNTNNNNKISNIKARSTDIYDSSRKKDYKSSKYSDIYPSYNAQKRKPGLNNKSNQKRNNQRNDSIPPMAPDTLGQAALRVMSAQRHKNTDLQNRITELNLELDKLKDENKTLKRIHMREEIAIKRFESQDYDLNRIMRNHTEESNSLKEQIKKIKLENRRLNSNLIEKEEEVRSVRKKNEEFKQILNDKKLLDSVELSKSLEQAEKDLQELKIKFDVNLI
jgi:hypothetical protein